MSFDQKLTSLMNLFKISNIQLARGIDVDPSIISRWKSGDRKVSANSPHIFQVAEFFLHLEAQDYQKEYIELILSAKLSDHTSQDDGRAVLKLSDWLVSIQPQMPRIIEQPLFDKSPVGISINRHAQILYVNHAFVKMFGYSDSAELHGTPIINQVALEFRKNVADMVRLQEQEGRLSEPYESLGIRKNNSTFPIYVEISNIVLPDGPASIAFISDITERKLYEKKLKHQVVFQKLLLEISKSFTEISSKDLDDLILDALRKIGQFNEDDRSYVFLYSEDGTTVSNTHEWCADGIHAEKDNMQNIDALSHVWWHQSVHRLEHIYVPSVKDLPDDEDAKKILLEQKIQSLIVVPMISNGMAIGFIGFDSVRKAKAWPEESIMMLEFVAQVVANGIMQRKYLKALGESENYYRTIFNAGNPKLIVDEECMISISNEEFLKMTGFSKEEVEGSILFDYFSQDTVKKAVAAYQRQNSGGYAATPQHLQKITDKSGKNREVLINYDSIPGTRKTLVTLSDHTEYFRINRALETTRACNMAIIHVTNEQELINLVCQKIIETGGYKFVWLGYLEKNEKQSLCPVAFAGHENGYLANLDICLADPVRGRGPSGLSIISGKNIVCKNMLEDRSFYPWREDAIKRGYISSIAIPLSIVGGDPIGSLNIYSDEADVFDEEEEKLLSEIGLNLTYGILSMRAQSEQKQTASQLEISLKKAQRNLNQTVMSLATVLEIRDPYTAGHQRKVTKLATAIAREMGLSEDQTESVFVAATLHDIGKMNVPNEILSKPGKLTDMEFGLIKTHCQAGYEIVKEIEFPWPIADIIYQHHERMDGTGYPNQLIGEEILLPSRIIAVADVVEAMASHRPYRPAMGLDKALEEISRLNCGKYDQAVVKACLTLFKVRGFVLT